MIVKADEFAAGGLRDHFLGWQCRIRQKAVRDAGGRPSPGMRPRIVAASAEVLAEAVTVVIAEAEPEATTAEFRHIVRRTHDPRSRYEAAIKWLAAAYYQHPDAFADRLTALFAPGAALARRLAAEARCVLVFRQYGQSYRIPCDARALREQDPAWQATYWHNAMFNPAMPPDPIVIAFDPDWAEATAFPPVETARAGARGQNLR